jgi:hypothetical protein
MGSGLKPLFWTQYPSKASAYPRPRCELEITLENPYLSVQYSVKNMTRGFNQCCHLLASMSVFEALWRWLQVWSTAHDRASAEQLAEA